MRIDSITAINAHDQQTQHSNQYSGSSSGKSPSGRTFEDYLKAHIQQDSTAVISSQAESHVAGILMSFISPLKLTQKSEPEPISNVS